MKHHRTRSSLFSTKQTITTLRRLAEAGAILVIGPKDTKPGVVRQVHGQYRCTKLTSHFVCQALITKDYVAEYYFGRKIVTYKITPKGLEYLTMVLRDPERRGRK